MRNTVYLLLAVALVFSLTLQSRVTSASSQRMVQAQQIDQAIPQGQPDGLTNYDVRLEARTAMQSRVNKLGVEVDATDSRVMQKAMETFPEGRSRGARKKL